jgi:hypothetical protein
MKKHKKAFSFFAFMSEKPSMNCITARKDISEWRMDTKGYFLIDPRRAEGLIYAHYYTKDKQYQVSIKGESAEEIYYTILREGLISSLMHAAYIGSELQKAECYLHLKNVEPYVQDKPLGDS